MSFSFSGKLAENPSCCSSASDVEVKKEFTHEAHLCSIWSHGFSMFWRALNERQTNMCILSTEKKAESFSSLLPVCARFELVDKMWRWDDRANKLVKIIIRDLLYHKDIATFSTWERSRWFNWLVLRCDFHFVGLLLNFEWKLRIASAKANVDRPSSSRPIDVIPLRWFACTICTRFDLIHDQMDKLAVSSAAVAVINEPNRAESERRDLDSSTVFTFRKPQF